MPASALRLKCDGVFQARGADAGRQAELRVVGDRQRLVVVLRADHGRHRPEDLLAGDAHLVAHLGEQGRRQIEAGRVARSAARRRRRAWRLPPGRSGCTSGPGRAGSGRPPGRYACRPSGRRRSTRPFIRSGMAATNRSWMPSVTIRREEAVQRWPVEKKAPLTAHSTATFRSASSSTTIGFLPPISSWTFFIGSAAMQVWATLRPGRHRAGEGDGVTTLGSSACASPTTEPRPMTRLNTPAGTPARMMISESAWAEPGTRSAGLNTTRVAVGERRRDLPGRDGDREVPRRDQADDADRLAGDLHIDAGPHGRHLLAGHAQALAGEEQEDLAGAGRPRRCPRAGSCLPRATSRRPSSSLRARISSPTRFRMSWRCWIEERDQAGKASLAAAIARSASAARGAGILADHVVGVGRIDVRARPPIADEPLARNIILRHR